MRYANTFILLGVLGVAILATRLTPWYVETMLWPAGEAMQRQILRKMCRDVLARHRTIYGERPIEEWPSEGARQIHANVERILAELEETKP